MSWLFSRPLCIFLPTSLHRSNSLKESLPLLRVKGQTLTMDKSADTGMSIEMGLEPADLAAAHILNKMQASNRFENPNCETVKAIKYPIVNGIIRDAGKQALPKIDATQNKYLSTSDSTSAMTTYSSVIAKARGRYSPVNSLESAGSPDFQFEDVQDAMTITNLHASGSLGLADLLGAVAMANENHYTKIPYTNSGLIQGIKEIWGVDFPRLLVSGTDILDGNSETVEEIDSNDDEIIVLDEESTPRRVSPR